MTADPVAVSVAIDELVTRLWGTGSRVLDDDGLNRVDAVAAEPGDDVADVWLTWRLTPVAGATRVRLVLDELEPGPEPIEELNVVLDMLAEKIGVVR